MDKTPAFPSAIAKVVPPSEIMAVTMIINQASRPWRRIHQRVQPRIECSCFLENSDESSNYKDEQDYVDRFISPMHGRFQNCDYALRVCGKSVLRVGN